MKFRVLILLLCSSAVFGGESYKLQDYLGRNWRNECVTFVLSEAQMKHAKAGHALIGPASVNIPYQIVSNNGSNLIAFETDLTAFETREFKFSEAAANQKTDIKVEDAADKVVLSNTFTGVSLRKKLAKGEGPLDGVRLLSGTWVGTSQLESDTVPSEYNVEITAKGPVYAEAICHAKFGGDSTWDFIVRVYANEPVVLIDENFNVMSTKAVHKIELGRNFAPDTLVNKRGKGQFVNTIYPVAAGEVYVLDPWVHWWERERQGQSATLYKAAGTNLNDPSQKAPVDALTFSSREAGVWVDPAIPGDQRAGNQITLTKTGDSLSMPMQIKKGVRKWMFTALNARDVVAQFQGKTDVGGTILPDEYMIKHGEFPLNQVKDYVLKWPSEKTSYPRLFVTKEGLPELRKNVRKPETYASQVDHWRQPNNGQVNLEVFYVTGDEGIAKRICENLMPMLQGGIDGYVKAQGLPLGAAPHMQQGIATPIAIADAALSYDKLAPETRERILAQLAFLGYVFDSPNYWSPVRGYKANPNMTTAVNGYKMMIGCLLPTHPKSKEWCADALAELKHQLNDWSDENGGWLESPHYAAAGFDQLLAGFMMAKNAGLDDSLYSPRLKKITEWFGKISTPPDSRLSGTRHLPAIGNTWLFEPTGIFGTMAYLWKDKDPEFAAQMQWMFEQHRSWPSACIGGGYPGMIGCNGLYRGSSVKPKAPAWGSELFPKTGVMLRDKFPVERETQLHMIAGPNHEHYDDDSGSITMWGKGRIIAEDFGYNGLAPQDDHSLVMAPGVGGIMNIDAFNTTGNLDYVHGVKGRWTRQIAFVKSKSADSTPYFMITDTLANPSEFKWQMWLAAKNVVVGKEGEDLVKVAADYKGSQIEDGTAMDPKFSQGAEATRALMVGREDVDMDVFMLTPSGYTLRTQKKMCKTVGLDPTYNQKQIEMTLIGLIAESKQGSGLATVLIPRMKGQPAATVTAIANGAGAKIKTASGIDYVFLSNTPIDFKEGDISFSGTTGLIQIRGNDATLSLGAAGMISAKGKELKK